MRGQINDVNFDKMLGEATKELEEAKRLQPNRAETYYNLAILTQEFRAREGGEAAEAVLKQAQTMYQDFVTKAGAEPVYADGVKRAKERMEEIGQMITFNQESRAAAKEDAERRKAAVIAQKKAEADAAAAKAAGGDAAPALPMGRIPVDLTRLRIERASRQ